MNQDDLRLSRIETLWSVVRQANEAVLEKAKQAQQTLLERYGGAVRRYLLGSFRNEDAADEVFQEFALKLVSGAFQKADASHGRFRSFLKTTLFHLIVDYQRRGKRDATRALLDDTPDRPFCEDRLAEEDGPGRGVGGRSSWPRAGRPWPRSSSPPARPITRCFVSAASIPSCDRRKSPTSLTEKSPKSSDPVRSAS